MPDGQNPCRAMSRTAGVQKSASLPYFKRPSHGPVTNTHIIAGRLFDTQPGQSFLPAGTRFAVDFLVEAAAVAVHGDEQRPETVDPELPDRLGVEVVQVHVLDRVDPRGFERGRAADDRKVR